METVTIKGIWRNDKDKNGKEFVTKDGRPYIKVAIKSVEYPEKYLYGFGNKVNEVWKEGDKVEVIIDKNGEYWNFKAQPKIVTRKEFEELQEYVRVLSNEIKELKVEVETIGIQQNQTDAIGEIVDQPPF